MVVRTSRWGEPEEEPMRVVSTRANVQFALSFIFGPALRAGLLTLFNLLLEIPHAHIQRLT